MQQVFSSGHHVEYLRSKFHHTEGMLKALVSCARIDEVGKRKLMNVAEALKWARIDDAALVRADGNERMNWVPEFMAVLHSPMRPNQWGY